MRDGGVCMCLCVLVHGTLRMINDLWTTNVALMFESVHVAAPPWPMDMGIPHSQQVKDSVSFF